MRGITFSEEMVRALAADKKTQTRRIIKETTDNFVYVSKVVDGKTREYTKALFGSADGKPVFIPLPYKRGETLYVKETYCRIHTPSCGSEWLYKAQNPNLNCVKWVSPRFMPEKAARLFIRIKNIWVEHLNKITTESTQKEGFKDTDEFFNYFINLHKGKATSGWVWAISFERTEKR